MSKYLRSRWYIHYIQMTVTQLWPMGAEGQCRAGHLDICWRSTPFVLQLEGELLTRKRIYELQC